MCGYLFKIGYDEDTVDEVFYNTDDKTRIEDLIKKHLEYHVSQLAERGFEMRYDPMFVTRGEYSTGDVFVYSDDNRILVHVIARRIPIGE